MKDCDVEAKWSFFKNKIAQLIKEYVPIRQEPRTQKKSWIAKATYHNPDEEEQDVETLQRAS